MENCTYRYTGMEESLKLFSLWMDGPVTMAAVVLAFVGAHFAIRFLARAAINKELTACAYRLKTSLANKLCYRYPKNQLHDFRGLHRFLLHICKVDAKYELIVCVANCIYNFSNVENATTFVNVSIFHNLSIFYCRILEECIV